LVLFFRKLDEPGPDFSWASCDRVYGSQLAPQPIEVAQNGLGVFEARDTHRESGETKMELSHWKQTTRENGETKTKLSH
jgi:hypothetical protein